MQKIIGFLIVMFVCSNCFATEPSLSSIFVNNYAYIQKNLKGGEGELTKIFFIKKNDIEMLEAIHLFWAHQSFSYCHKNTPESPNNFSNEWAIGCPLRFLYDHWSEINKMVVKQAQFLKQRTKTP